jgi:hypothetical protein
MAVRQTHGKPGGLMHPQRLIQHCPPNPQPLSHLSPGQVAALEASEVRCQSLCSVTGLVRRGRPTCLPSARARSMPACTRSASICFSSCAQESRVSTKPAVNEAVVIAFCDAAEFEAWLDAHVDLRVGGG